MGGRSWLLSLEINTVTRVQIVNETVCISHSANTLGKLRIPTC